MLLPLNLKRSARAIRRLELPRLNRSTTGGAGDRYYGSGGMDTTKRGQGDRLNLAFHHLSHDRTIGS
jgi:hypothetical protein